MSATDERYRKSYTERYRCPRGHITWRSRFTVGAAPRIDCPACNWPAVRAPVDQPLSPAQSVGCCLARTREECVRNSCPCNQDAA